MIDVHLRWVFSNDQGFPFCYRVFEKQQLKKYAKWC